MAKKVKKKKEKKTKAIAYNVSGEKLERKKIICPKCGPGIFLAEHKDRYTCGKCSYTQWKTTGEKK